MVASVAGSDHSIYTGIAKGAKIIDACTDGSITDTLSGLIWANNYSNVVNFSYSLGDYPGGTLSYTDKAFDHYARFAEAFITKSAGNDGDYVTSPGGGWNVMTVGATNYNETANWFDDEIWSNSSYMNPTNVEKPEVVAPGANIRTIGNNGIPYTTSGTSLSAPQVAGLAALLVDRNITLASWPNAIKAIIMASAVNNTDGSSVITDGTDLKDGAGAIDAALADRIASNQSSSTCNEPCWMTYASNNSNFPVDSSKYRYIYATKGESVRVAVTWWSKVFCTSTSNCSDELGTDLDIFVKLSDGTPVISSTSDNNNYELVEFVAPSTSSYTIEIYKDFSTDSSYNDIGIAINKDATYLPDIRFKDGFLSELRILNSSAEPQNVYVTFSNGAQTIWWSLPPNSLWQFPVSQKVPTNFIGSAIVNAGEGVDVVVENIYNVSPRYMAASYPGETRPANNVYAPIVMKRWPWGYYWRQTTDLIIQNPNAQSATVSVTFYDSWDYSGSTYSLQRTITANGQTIINGTLLPTWSSSIGGTLASARIVSTKPVVVSTLTKTGDYNSSGEITTPWLAASYRAFTSGGQKVYMPAAACTYYTYDCSLQVQNLSNSSTEFSIKYYQLDTSDPFITLTESIGPYLSKNFWHPTPDCHDYLGGAVVEVTSSGDGPIAVMAGYDKKDITNSLFGSSHYEGITVGTKKDVLPHVIKSSPWTYTGILAQNVQGYTTNISLQFLPNGTTTTHNAIWPDEDTLFYLSSEFPAINGFVYNLDGFAAFMVNFDRSSITSFTNRDTMMGYGAVR